MTYKQFQRCARQYHKKKWSKDSAWRDVMKNTEELPPRYNPWRKDHNARFWRWYRIDLPIFCCQCDKEVLALQATGAQIYHTRHDLFHLNFWRCPHCQNYVGTHKGTFKPLGVIPTQPMRAARNKLHQFMDPIWKDKHMSRGAFYKALSAKLGVNNFHTANTRTMDELRDAWRAVAAIKKEIADGQEDPH